MRSLFIVIAILLIYPLYAEKSEFDEYFKGIYKRCIEVGKESRKAMMKRHPELHLKEMSKSEIDDVMESYGPLEYIIRKQSGIKNFEHSDYPNPYKRNSDIGFDLKDNKGRLRIDVYDRGGRRIYYKYIEGIKYSKHKIRLDLPQGTYILKTTGNAQQLNKSLKFVVFE